MTINALGIIVNVVKMVHMQTKPQEVSIALFSVKTTMQDIGISLESYLKE